MDYKRLLWTSLLILAAGIFLLCYKLPSLTFVVTCLGYLFLASAVLNITMLFARASRRDEEGKKEGLSVLGILSAVASGALGLWMVISPEGFTTAMIYILGALMIIGGLFLIFTMAAGFRPVKFPFGFYILPALVTICGIVCVCSPVTIEKSIVLITAIAMIVYAVGALIEVAALISYRRNLAPAAPVQPVSTPEPKVEDVTATEITDHSDSAPSAS